jgi:hypothetical protein
MAWTERRPMCGCADSESSWNGHGESARYMCTCGGTTESQKGLAWLPVWVPDAIDEDGEDDE